MDHKVRIMIEKGVRPIVALAMVTINPANYFRTWDRGAVAPGRLADLAMVESLEECRALKVWKRGVLVAENGSPIFRTKPSPFEAPHMPKLAVEFTAGAFRVASFLGKKIRVIEAMPDVVLTKELITEPLVSDGAVISDTNRDIIKMAVVEKNRGSGRVGIGFVKGFGLKKGAIASSVAHDAHNYSCVGADDESMKTAFEFLAKNSGGLVATDGKKVLESLALPIGGLMSESSPKGLSDALGRMLQAARSLGCVTPQPFMTMSFLSLSVIPELKLTDQGYVNAAQNRLEDLFA
jgi:adenine deaminase